MRKQKLFLLVAILAVVLLVGVAGCTPGEIQALEGTLQNLDSVSGNVTVKLKDGSTTTFNLTDINVETIRQALGGASLEIGDQVTIKAHKTHKNGNVDKLGVRNAEVGGVIKTLGTDNVTITTNKRGDITLQVTTNTTIRIEDRGKIAFSDLKVGQKVEVKYDVSTHKVLRINVDIEQPDRNLQGTIKAINTDNKTITIAGRNRVDITLNVTSNTTIRIEDKRIAALSDLQVGQKVEAKYDVNTNNALKLTLDGDEDERDGKNRNSREHRKD